MGTTDFSCQQLITLAYAMSWVLNNFYLNGHITEVKPHSLS
jgi:hypothetical protein